LQNRNIAYNILHSCFLSVILLDSVGSSLTGFFFGLSILRSVKHVFGSCLLGVTSKIKKNMIFTGVAALCWAIWTSRNDLVFDKTPMVTYLQVMF
jgi:hypothetical protein